MSPVKIQAFLERHRRIAIDTSIFIYQIEGHAEYAALAEPVFAWLERGRHSAVASTVTMLELLVQPYRAEDIDRVNRFYALLVTYPNLEWIPLDLAIADLAARYRAAHGLRTPDAIQSATAVTRAATGFVTNDAVFRRIRPLDVLLLNED